MAPQAGLAQSLPKPAPSADLSPPPGTCPIDPQEAQQAGCAVGGLAERAGEMKDIARSMAGSGIAAGTALMLGMLEAWQKAAVRDSAQSTVPGTVTASPQKP
jgi:hypothetical protein